MQRHYLVTSTTKAIAERVCAVAGDVDMIADVRAAFAQSGIADAVRTRDDEALFAWLMATVSFQGIGDAVAASYMDAHGRIAAHDIASSLGQAPTCSKLAAYWTYADCRYHKGSQTCAEPDHFDRCPLPRHDLRNGRLNQTAYALYLFLRDVAQGDFVAWIDRQLGAAKQAGGTRTASLGAAVIEPLGHVHGVSNKVLSMALADLFLALGDERPLWLEAGVGMIAIDSLAHNWLHRTGILAKMDCEHPYGLRCYSPGGCSDVLFAISESIDARAFNPDYPRVFPRFVQKAIWTFCARSGLDQCNGNRIDDRKACDQADCPLGDLCDRRVLNGF
jgi:hypothetical protein